MKKPFAVVLASLLICVFVIPVSLSQDPPPAQTHPPHRVREAPERLSFWGLTRSVNLESNVASTSARRSVVFQSFQDGNWEIYSDSPYGSVPTRLTNHAASDIHPRFNPGCTRILFASNRTGSFEIFSMRSDGTGVIQLTSNNADDVNPVWSSDGHRIAFQSYRDGQAEIYVMNADGSDQTRLTTNSTYNGYDGEPTWSPDSSKIAFTSTRTSGYRIWVMNADGSGQTQLSNQAYSEHPSWSPDGSQIAYDSDGNGDGWQELWLMNADGTNQRQVYKPLDADTDAWASGWSPDGRYITFTRITLIYYQGNWYWMYAYAEAWNVSDEFRLGFQGNMEWKPDWQAVAPSDLSSHVHDLPPYTRSPFAVSWSGRNNGGPAIESYHVQYSQVPTQTWADWQVETRATSREFSGVSGQTYRFRSMAIDWEHNMEAWPPGNGDASTTLYTWGVVGTTRDNTGTPVAVAVITTTPQSFVAVPSDLGGRYANYVVDHSDRYTVTWEKHGYGDLPSTAFGGEQDAVVDIFLPPTDNTVSNWGFEAGTLAGWTTVGTASLSGAEARHTGSYAVTLGSRAPFASAINLSQTSDSADYPQFAVSADGTTHIIWQQQDIFYAERAADGTWSSPLNISNTEQPSAIGLLRVDSAGIVHVVWREGMWGGGGVYYTYRDLASSWSLPQQVSEPGMSVGGVALAVDESNAVHIVWAGDVAGSYEIFYARRDTNGTWSSRINISNTPGDSYYPEVVADQDRAVHTIWYDTTPGAKGIYHRSRSVDGNWSLPYNISDSEYTRYPFEPAVDADGTLYVLWSENVQYQNREIFGAQRTRDGTWSTHQNVSHSEEGTNDARMAIDREGVAHVVWRDHSSGNADIYYANYLGNGLWSCPLNISSNTSNSYEPQLLVSPSGDIHVAWADDASGEYEIYYVSRAPNGDWSSPANLSSTPGWSRSVQLAMGADESIHVAWRDNTPGTPNIYYVGQAAAEQTGEHAISQAVTLPVTMSTPILSFLYRLGGASDGTWFDVQLDDGITATSLLSTSLNASWTHKWFSLTPYSGQIVTVTFTIHQTAGASHTWAQIDEVTIGSAHADVWIRSDDLPVAALPGEQIAYTISYGNQGGAAANGVTVTNTLAAELLFIDAEPYPVIQGPPQVWSVGNLAPRSGPYTIVVTATVLPSAPRMAYYTNTMGIETVSPELEAANNRSELTLWTGAYLYLPAIFKEY